MRKYLFFLFVLTVPTLSYSQNTVTSSNKGEQILRKINNAQKPPFFSDMYRNREARKLMTEFLDSRRESALPDTLYLVFASSIDQASSLFIIRNDSMLIGKETHGTNEKIILSMYSLPTPDVFSMQYIDILLAWDTTFLQNKQVGMFDAPHYYVYRYIYESAESFSVDYCEHECFLEMSAGKWLSPDWLTPSVLIEKRIRHIRRSKPAAQ